MKDFYVYILATYKKGTLYIGSCDDLVKRIWQHKNKVSPNSFTARYDIDKLVYYEVYEDSYEAICRERIIKDMLRKKKIALIEKNNSQWQDLYKNIT